MNAAPAAGVGTVLIFPAGMPDGLAHRNRARALGCRVVGASSVPNDPASSEYDAWEPLPYVSDPSFDEALVGIIRKHGIGAVHAPHFVVFDYLFERLAHLAPGAKLTGAEGPQDHERAYQALRARTAVAAAVEIPGCEPLRPALSLVERAGIVRLVNTIPGMCAEEKMHTLIEVMRRAPPGDVVEIGSWWGRSAALLVWLAGRYDVGQVLCVDPWISDAMPQGDPLLDRTSAALDTEEALRMFQINIAPLAQGRLNYLRARAEDAAGAYGQGLTVRTEVFGEVRYAGVISVLHIDGNHAEHHAALDTALWTPHVQPDGWIIFDDYEWAFGDGPRKVADRFVEENKARLEAVFQSGPCLFVQLKGSDHG